MIKQNRGVFDAAPLSLVTTQTVKALGEGVGSPRDPQRFRPNLEAAGAEPMRVDWRDERCVVVNVDPATSVRDPAVRRTVAQEREACVGVYGSVVQPGRVAVRDPAVAI